VAAGVKVYMADIALGTSTDSADADGRVVGQRGMAPLDTADIVEALKRFLGPISQRPPAFAALKLDGRRAYERARRGESVVLAPRLVEVYDLAILEHDPPRLSLLVRCSKGTYIRAIARDVGAALGCDAHLDTLVRAAVGRFTLADSITVDQFIVDASANNWGDYLLPADDLLTDMPSIVVASDQRRRFLHGQCWTEPTAAEAREARVYSVAGAFFGVARREADCRWQPALSFVYDAAAATSP
jgi:tRNA pseudouridine55 synthase